MNKASLGFFRLLLVASGVLAFSASLGCSSYLTFQEAERIDSREAYQWYLHHFDTGEHADRARQRLHELAWESATASDKDPLRYEWYLNTHKQHLTDHGYDDYARIARQRIHELCWAEAKQQNSHAGYSEYLKTARDCELHLVVSNAYTLAQERIEWCRATANDTWRSYENYVLATPDTSHSKVALERAIGRDQPLSFHELRGWDGGTQHACIYREYIERFPHGELVECARDRLAWAAAERVGTNAAYNSYLKSNPSGEFVALARENLNSLRPECSEDVAQLLEDSVRTRAVRQLFGHPLGSVPDPVPDAESCVTRTQVVKLGDFSTEYDHLPGTKVGNLRYVRRGTDPRRKYQYIELKFSEGDARVAFTAVTGSPDTPRTNYSKYIRSAKVMFSEGTMCHHYVLGSMAGRSSSPMRTLTFQRGRWREPRTRPFFQSF